MYISYVLSGWCGSWSQRIVYWKFCGGHFGSLKRLFLFSYASRKFKVTTQSLAKFSFYQVESFEWAGSFPRRLVSLDFMYFIFMFSFSLMHWLPSYQKNKNKNQYHKPSMEIDIDGYKLKLIVMVASILSFIIFSRKMEIIGEFLGSRGSQKGQLCV